MPVTTTHQYINLHPFKKTDARLIIGTIHPHVHEDFNIPYFYGNVGSLWGILAEAFPQHNFTTYESIRGVLDEHNVAITDVITQCDREHDGITQDRLLTNLVFNTQQIREAITETSIDTIFFTSRFGKNNAAKLFTDLFDITYQATYDETSSEFTIPVDHFGKEIRCVVLYSPSGQANVGISKSLPYINNIELYREYATPVKQFKIDFYKEKFTFLD